MKMKRREWEKMIANHGSDKGLILRIYREFLKLKNNNQKETQFKYGKGLEYM